MPDAAAYLEAMGLTVWVRRDRVEPPKTGSATGPNIATQAPVSTAPTPAVSGAASQRAQVVAGPGNGSCLYLCGPGDETSSPLASDLARVLGAAPVWGSVADGGEGQPLEVLIAERLFTQLVIFGEASARLVFGGAIPETCGPARVTVVDDLRRLAGDPGARRSCWAAFRAAGIVSRP